MSKISVTNKSNYLAKIVKLQGVRKHSNADRLQCVDIDFQTVITGMDAKDGDIYVYFPVGSKIHMKYLSDTNSFADKELNADKDAKGYFNKRGVVKATRLRQEKSFGYIVPAEEIGEYFGYNSLHLHIDEEFDTIGTEVICEKYVVSKRGGDQVKGKKAKSLSRLVDGQVHLHEDTDNLRKNITNIAFDDDITITYKLHGTSGWVSNVLVKRKLNFLEKAFKFFGGKVQETEYDLVYGSRKVVKNRGFEQKSNHFYGYDLWKAEVEKQELDKLVPKGYSLYYELVGYTREGAFVQKSFDYGLEIGQSDIYVYRVTHTNPDGIVYNLNTLEAKAFTEKLGLKFVPVIHANTSLQELFPEIVEKEHVHRELIAHMEALYNDKDCYMCVNKVPEEGIVLRKERTDYFEAYKLKSFSFLELETKQLEKGEENIEDQN